MAAHHRNITDTELDILKVLWELGEGSVRDVLDRLPEERPPRWALARSSRIMEALRVRKIRKKSLGNI